jgi:predicted phage terminase large subunit-like protein
MAAAEGLVLPSPEAAKSHPALWGIYASEGAWVPYAWLRWLCQEIDSFLRGPDRYMALSVPPGHGKSEFLSKFFVTWFLGVNPGARVIQASYAASLTLEWSKVSKELLALHGNEVFGVEVSPRAKSEAWDVHRWDAVAKRSKRSGYLRAVGRGGPVTGKRAELLILDDLLKDDEEAQSQTIRDKTWNWLMKVALTRLTKTGKAAMIATRWHHDDPIGRLEDRKARGLDKEGWKIIRLPAIAEADDPMGRKPGEPLCPELFPLEELERIKARDAHTWASLYQGRPTGADGAIYKREHFRYARVFADHIEVPGGAKPLARAGLIPFVTADLAVVEKTYADTSAFGCFLADLQYKRLFMVGLSRGQMDGPAILSTLKRLHQDGYQLHAEKTAWHLHLLQVAVSQGIPVRALEADKDKVSRAHPAVAFMEGGRFFFAEGAAWLPDVEAELLQFPAGRYKDVADVVAYAVRVFNDMLGTRGIEYEIEPSPWGGGGDWWDGRGRGGGW